MSYNETDLKAKYLQIFQYLLEFSKLRSNPVRDIEGSDQYPEIVWLADIPQCEIFDCVTFQNYNQDADYWLKISKPKEPQHPIFPKLSETLSDSHDYPQLKSSGINRFADFNPDSIMPYFLHAFPNRLGSRLAIGFAA